MASMNAKDRRNLRTSDRLPQGARPGPPPSPLRKAAAQQTVSAVGLSRNQVLLYIATGVGGTVGVTMVAFVAFVLPRMIGDSTTEVTPDNEQAVASVNPGWRA